MGKLFGTDGIRGKANTEPITAETALRIGKALASSFAKTGKTSKFIIGKDTRLSGDMLEHAVASGICSMGGDACLAGVLPTPGVAFLASSMKAAAGVVISASHNPYYDNGIKLFGGNGFKLTDARETEIENLVLNGGGTAATETGTVRHIPDALQKYKDFLKKRLRSDNLKGIKIVMDCANGASFRIAPELFEELGADVEILSNSPDGRNINENCGSEHPESLRAKVLEIGADIGLAFDGDADRLIAADETGNLVPGDAIIAILAKVMKQRGVLKNDCVVTTVMSNMGLKAALGEMGISHVAAKVGDRYVKEEMLARGSVLGGENSGHIILMDEGHTTGDGILAAIKLAETVRESKPLSELAKIMSMFPQEIINVEVREKPEISSVPEFAEVVRFVESSLGDNGRVLVRYSGTQAMCRVMVEGRDKDETKRHCERIAAVVREKIGI